MGGGVVSIDTIKFIHICGQTELIGPQIGQPVPIVYRQKERGVLFVPCVIGVGKDQPVAVMVIEGGGGAVPGIPGQLIG